MPDRLLTRFSCGLVCELEKPNIQLCVDILSNKIRRDGLKIPVDVISFIAQTCNGSVRDLQGAINGLLAYSIVYNSSIDIRLAERVIKRAVKVDDKPLTIDDIVETVCHHYNVTVTAVNSKSRKRDYVVARQVTMYLAQKYTKMPASRIEQWFFWIIVDAVCFYLYIFKGIPFKAGLYGLYVIIAVAGYFKWKKMMMKKSC